MGKMPRTPRKQNMGLVVLIALIICMVCGACSIISGLLLSSLARQTRATIVPVGGQASDGGMTFRVERMDCSMASVGSAPTVRHAQGRFCLIHLAVGNRGTVAMSFVTSLQRAVDGQGREYSVDHTAESLIAPDAWTGMVSPRSTRRGVIIFDVPVGVELVSVVLHAGTFGRGVKVRVR